MRPVAIAFGRALLSQLHFRMLLLSIVPFAVSIALWGVILYFFLQPMIDAVQHYFAGNDGFRITGNLLGAVGLGGIKTVIVPLIAMWVLLPLMILTALVLIGMLAMPAIVRHVSGRHFAALEQRKGGSAWGSAWISLSSFLVFLVLWLISIPLSVIPPLGFFIQPVLWGWLTYRVIAYDALARHADAQELKDTIRIHRKPLLVIGIITGAMGAAPMLLWLGGVLSVIFFPLLAALSIWLYVLTFIFTGLWFAYYCLNALTKLREAAAVHAASIVLPPLVEPSLAPHFIDIN